MHLQEIVNQERTFTVEEREKAMQYLMWYTCYYHREQLNKLSDEIIARMVQDTINLATRENK